MHHHHRIRLLPQIKPNRPTMILKHPHHLPRPLVRAPLRPAPRSQIHRDPPKTLRFIHIIPQPYRSLPLPEKPFRVPQKSVLPGSFVFLASWLSWSYHIAKSACCQAKWGPGMAEPRADTVKSAARNGSYFARKKFL
jgi:hypothetical protein